jgi:hypothetical protein
MSEGAAHRGRVGKAEISLAAPQPGEAGPFGVRYCEVDLRRLFGVVLAISAHEAAKEPLKPDADKKPPHRFAAPVEGLQVELHLARSFWGDALFPRVFELGSHDASFVP